MPTCTCTLIYSDLRECPFTFCKQFINRKKMVPSICLLLSFKINGACSQPLLLLHRAVLSAQVLLEEVDMVIFGSLCLPFLPFCPFPSLSVTCRGCALCAHPSRGERYEQSTLELPRSNTRKQGKNSFRQHSLEPSFYSDFPFSMLAECIFIILMHKYRGGQMSTRFLIFCENTSCPIPILRLQ